MYRIDDTSFVTSALNSYLNYRGRYVRSRTSEADKLKAAKRCLMVTLELIASRARETGRLSRI